MQLAILTVDDEEIICNELKNILETQCGQRGIQTCRSGLEALQRIEEQDFDLVFLDIQMPGISGIDVARVWASKENPPLVVFVTAFSEHALRAFAVDALDYILKPFDEQDIVRVMSKVVKRMAGKQNSGATGTEGKTVADGKFMHRFSVEGAKGFEVVESQEIAFIRALDRLVYVHTTAGDAYLARMTLQDYEGKVDPSIFYRCHRNYIVNVVQIKRLITWFNRGYMLELRCSKEAQIPVSRHYVKGLKEHIDF